MVGLFVKYSVFIYLVFFYLFFKSTERHGQRERKRERQTYRQTDRQTGGQTEKKSRREKIMRPVSREDPAVPFKQAKAILLSSLMVEDML